MGWRLFRRIKLLPEVRLNLTRRGPSVSIGGRGLTTTFGRRGRRTTVGIPGTGVSYGDFEAWRKDESQAATRPSCPACGARVSERWRHCANCGAALGG
jgi:hypothetical protein